jgi:hypothetical protein
MQAKKNPAPLVGSGDRAAGLHIHRVDSPNPKPQDHRSKRRPNGTAHKARVALSNPDLLKAHFRDGRRWPLSVYQHWLPRHVERIFRSCLVLDGSEYDLLASVIRKPRGLSRAKVDRLDGLLRRAIAAEALR